MSLADQNFYLFIVNITRTRNIQFIIALATIARVIIMSPHVSLSSQLLSEYKTYSTCLKFRE